MGLAPDGDPSRFRSFFQQAVAGLDDGSVTIASRGVSLVCNAGWHDQNPGFIPFASVLLKRVLAATSNDLPLAPWSQALRITMGETLHASKENQGRIVDLGSSNE